MDEKLPDDPSAMADEVLDEDPPFHPPVEPATEPAKDSLAEQSEAVENQLRDDENK